MTSKRANAVNRAIAEERGWTDIYEEEWFEDYSNLFGTFPGAVRPMPLSDYYHSLDEAIAAAGELLTGFTVYTRPSPHDHTKKMTTVTILPNQDEFLAQSNAPADIAAAICEAIVTARGLVVESVTED